MAMTVRVLAWSYIVVVFGSLTLATFWYLALVWGFL